MLLYAITSRNLLPGAEPERQAALVELARYWAHSAVDYIQIREKDLSLPDLLALSRRIVTAVRAESTGTRVLVNGPPEVALAAGADGVHLPSSAPAGAAGDARQILRSATREAIISRACHSLEEIRSASNVSLIVFAPVFEKVGETATTSAARSAAQLGVGPGIGLDALAEACHAADPVPVIALGGVTTQNAAACIAAGAAGIAGIRLFLGDDWRTLLELHTRHPERPFTK